MNRTAFCTFAVMALAAGLPPAVGAPETTMPLAELSHIHGVEFEKQGGGILLATHHGIFRFAPGTLAVLRSPDRSDYMGFTSLADGTIIASGHPEGGGNLGVLRSSDAGARWTKLSDGADGPVDFHAIAAAAGNADALYGLYQGGIQASADGGRTWAWSGDAPGRTFDIALSADGATLYAATSTGVQVSLDGGASWTALGGDLPAPTSTVAVMGDRLYAYVVGHGLVGREMAATSWQLLGPDMGETVPLHLAQDPQDALRLVAVTQDSAVLETRDGGSSWSPLE